MRAAGCTAAAFALAACGGGGGAPERHVVGIFSLEPSAGLDVLFVVDNSAGMQVYQQSLGANLDELVAPLEDPLGGFQRTLHLGVVSTDLGTAPFATPTCSADGDGAQLTTEVRTGTCTAPTDRYLSSSIADGNNFDGAIEDMFACITVLGGEGCGFEQPMEAMKRALGGTVPENQGFRRDDADLLVVFLGDEDDCSVFDRGLFDFSVVDIGPFSSFRCFEHGVACEGDSDPRAEGPRTGCAPREDSDFMDPSSAYADFLRTLVDDDTRIMISVIAGDPEPVAVDTNPENGDPVLAPSCTSNNGRADPAVRLAALAGEFPARGIVSSICTTDLTESMARTGALAASATGQSSCLIGTSGPDIATLDETCTATLQTSSGPVSIPRCVESAAPCFQIVANADCILDPTHAQFLFDPGAAPVGGTQIVVECP